VTTSGSVDGKRQSNSTQRRLWCKAELEPRRQELVEDGKGECREKKTEDK